jgi:hypothetical protein
MVGCSNAKKVNTGSRSCSVQWEIKEAPMQTTRGQMAHLAELSWAEKPYKDSASQDIQACKRICEDYRTCKTFIYRDHRDVYPNLTVYHCWFYGDNPTDWVYTPETSQSNDLAFKMDTWFVKNNDCR